MEARRYVVKGRVQGVGFRHYTYKTARGLQIRGWVRNLRNGDVEIHAEGPQEALDRFLAQITSGPSFASVNDVDVQEVNPENYDDFSIRH